MWFVTDTLSLTDTHLLSLKECLLATCLQDWTSFKHLLTDSDRHLAVLLQVDCAVEFKRRIIHSFG